MSTQFVATAVAVCLLGALTLTNAAGLTTSLPWEVADALLQLENVLGETEITGDITPIYRKDLDKEYVAYWGIEINNEEYLVLSAGVKTGDYRLNQEGTLPSPLSQMSAVAESFGDQCYRFYMLTPGGAMFCENMEGKVVATTLDDTFQSTPKGKNLTRDVIHEGLHKILPEMEKVWNRRAVDVEAYGEWDAVSVYDAIVDDDDVKRERENGKPIFGFNDETVGEQAIAPGDSVNIAISNITTGIKIKFLPFREKMSDEEVTQWQANLCKVTVNLCEGNDVITESSILTNAHGQRYITVEVVDDHKYVSTVLAGEEIGFQVELYMQDGTVVVRRFGVDLSEDEKLRRRKRSTDWTDWEEFTISEESLFPDYEQHAVDECDSGSAAVAWAMVFGYYDRLGHAVPNYGLEQALFRCGPDGTTGSDDCQADGTLTDRMKPYIEHLRHLLDIECFGGQGVVLQSDMDNVEDFFIERGGDHINVEKTDGFWFMNDLAYIPREHVRDYIAEIVESSRFPAIAGYHVDGAWWTFSPHYGVVTRVRQRDRRSRVCWGWWGGQWCSGWRTHTVREMYIHHGNGQTGNGWRDIEAFFAAVAFPH